MFPDLTPPDNNINLNTFPLFSQDPSPINQSAQDTSNPLESQWAWDLVTLGIQEELPPEEITNKLYSLSIVGLCCLEQRFTSKSANQ